MESKCRRVSSRGILFSCDLHTDMPTSSCPRIMVDMDFSKLKKNDTIYICNESIPDFVQNYMEEIQTDFILVSGDSDVIFPLDLHNALYMKLINNKHLKRWWCQNWIGDHEKVRTLPIGLDYHTLYNNENHEWGESASPQFQEETLLAKCGLPAWSEYSCRKSKCYSNFHFRMDTRLGKDRINCKELVPEELVFYEPKKVSREKSWDNQHEYSFVLSPYGGGVDCHRTWEAFSLGCIPIMCSTKSIPTMYGMDNMFDDLPILLVEKWEDVTQELLDKTLEEFKEKEWNLEKLDIDYWLNKIKDSWKPSGYVLGAARCCGYDLPYVIHNIETICDKLYEPVVNIFYDDSMDNTLEVLQKFSFINIIQNEEPLLDLRTERIAHARNKLIESMDQKKDLFIMMDMDNVCAGKMNMNIFDEVMEEQDKWDCVTFNRPLYYDIFALCYDNYLYNCWSYGELSQCIVNTIQHDISKKLKDREADKETFLEVYSAFNGFGIYKQSKFIDCKYCHKKIKNPNLLSYQTNDIPDNCEHIPFHIQARCKGAKICITPKILFIDECRD